MDTIKTVMSDMRGCPVWSGGAEEEMSPLKLLAECLKISWHHRAPAEMALYFNFGLRRRHVHLLCRDELL